MTSAVETLARQVAAALASVADIRVAWLFGSRVHDRARDDSDIDIAVSWPHDLDGAGREDGRRSIVAALTDALGPLGETADVVDIDRADSGVAFRAISEGRLVLELSAADRIAACTRVARRYDDDAPNRARFLEAARRLRHRA